MSRMFKTLKIKEYTFKNRIIMSPMCMYKVNNEDGIVTDFHLIHYGSRALGGPSLVIVESTGVTPNGRISVNDLGIWSDDHIEGLSKISKVIHDGNALAGIQLNHAGRKARVFDNVGPTTESFSDRHNSPSALTINQIEEIVKSFGKAAQRAHKAGFDLLEIHAAHGYLINQFLSPLVNNRDDIYKDKTLFLKQVLDEVLKYWPQNKLLSLRISAYEYHEDGLNPKIWVDILNELKDYPIDIIDVSSGGTVLTTVKAYPLYQIDYAKYIKDNTNYFVLGGGLISNINHINQALDNNVDLVYLGRKLLRDPYFLIKYNQDLLNSSYLRAKV